MCIFVDNGFSVLSAWVFTVNVMNLFYLPVGSNVSDDNAMDIDIIVRHMCEPSIIGSEYKYTTGIVSVHGQKHGEGDLCVCTHVRV